jgi:hypothetical protein
LISRKEIFEMYDDYQFLNVERCDDWVLRNTINRPETLNASGIEALTKFEFRR